MWRHPCPCSPCPLLIPKLVSPAKFLPQSLKIPFFQVREAQKGPWNVPWAVIRHSGHPPVCDLSLGVSPGL